MEDIKQKERIAEIEAENYKLLEADPGVSGRLLMAIELFALKFKYRPDTESDLVLSSVADHLSPSGRIVVKELHRIAAEKEGETEEEPLLAPYADDASRYKQSLKEIDDHIKNLQRWYAEEFGNSMKRKWYFTLHGKDFDNRIENYRCEQCGFILQLPMYEVDTKEYVYCPHCGKSHDGFVAIQSGG